MKETGNIQKKVMIVFDEKHKELFCVNEASYNEIAWIPKEIKAMKLLRELIARRLEKKQELPPSHEDIVFAIGAFLDIASKVSDGFYLRMFSPMSLYSNFNNIVSSYQNESINKNKRGAISSTARDGIDQINKQWASEGRGHRMGDT